MHDAGHHLDHVARSLEKWGTVWVSGATLIEPDPQFQLDLNLSGRQIFERNRFEGFSNISQVRATDVQLAVQAEIVANLINQMQGTTEPKVLDQLKQRLLAAALEGLLGKLPEEQQTRLRPILEPVSQRLQQGAAQAPGAPTDASAGQLTAGEQALETAARVIAEAKRLQEAIAEDVTEADADAVTADNTPDHEKREAFGDASQQFAAVVANLDSAADRPRESTGQFGTATGEALEAALDAQKRLEALPTLEERSGATEA